MLARLYVCAAALSRHVVLLRKSFPPEHLLFQEIFEGQARLVLRVHCFILEVAMKRHSHVRVVALL